MFCSNCNKKVPEDSLFCPYCDAPQNRAAAQARDKAWAKAGGSKRFLYGLIIAEFVLIVILTITLANRPISQGTPSSSAPGASLNNAPTAVISGAQATPYPAPASIKAVVAKQKDGADFSVYIVLADAQGASARGEGEAMVDIVGPDGASAFLLDRPAKPENFVPLPSGDGTSAAGDIIFSFGLVSYSGMVGGPPSGKTYKLHATFNPVVGTPVTKDSSVTLQ